MPASNVAEEHYSGILGFIVAAFALVCTYALIVAGPAIASLGEKGHRASKVIVILAILASLIGVGFGVTALLALVDVHVAPYLSVAVITLTICMASCALALTSIARDSEQPIKLVMQQRAADATAESHFHECPIGMAYLSMDGRWVKVNHQVERITGYSSSELTGGMTWQEITTPDTLGADEDNVSRLLTREIPRYRFDKAYTRKDGSRVEVRVTISVVGPIEQPVFLAFIEEVSSATLEARRVTQEAAGLRARLERKDDTITRLSAQLRVETTEIASDGQRKR